MGYLDLSFYIRFYLNLFLLFLYLFLVVLALERIKINTMRII